jgi:hypothetical protein
MANSTNLARTFLIAACWLGTVRLLPAGERTIVLRDYLNQQWTNELLAYPFSAPEGTCHPESVVLTGPRGQPVPVQLSDIEYWPNAKAVKSAKLSFLASLAPLATDTYTVSYGNQPVPAAPLATDLTVTPGKDHVEITTQQFGARLLLGERTYAEPVAASEVPGPVGAMRLADGTWFGGSAMYGPGKLKGYSAKLTDAGPVFARVAVRYTYENGNTLDLSLQVAAGDNTIRGETKVARHQPKDGFNLVLSRGLPPFVFQVQDEDGQTDREVFAKKARWGHPAWAEIPLKDYVAPKGQPAGLVTQLTPWEDWFGTFTQTRIRLKLEGTQRELQIRSLDPGAWVEPKEIEAIFDPRLDSDPLKGLWVGWQDKLMPVRKDASGEIALEVNAAQGVRKWTLSDCLSMPGVAALFTHYQYRPENTFPRETRPLVGCLLDEVKDWVLSWPGDQGRHPCLFMKRAELEAIWKRRDADPKLLAQLAEWGSLPPGAEVRYNPGASDDYALGAYLLSGGTGEMATRTGMLRRLHQALVYDLWGYQFGVAGAATPILYDALVDSPVVPDAEQPIIRAQMAAYGYRLADPAVWSAERGYCSGNQNMTVTWEISRGLMACAIPDHPMARTWYGKAQRIMEYFLDHMVGPAGEWPEAMGGHGRTSVNMIEAFAIASSNSGLHDYVNDPRLKRLIMYWAKLQTPRDPRPRGMAGATPNRRYFPPMGRDGISGVGGTCGYMARLTRDTDPVYSSDMQWAWLEEGADVSSWDHMGGFSYVACDKTLPARTPAWTSEVFPCAGAVLRHGLATPNEHQVTLYSGDHFAAFYPQHTGSFPSLFAYGVPVVGAFPSGYEDQEGYLTSNVGLARGLGTIEERTAVAGYHGSPQRANMWNWPNDERTARFGEHGGLGNVSSFSTLPRQDYAAVDVALHYPIRMVNDWRTDLPAWPPIPAPGKPPVDWRRQVLFLKDDDSAKAGNYLLIRDSVRGVNGPQPTMWQMWTVSETVDTPERVRDVAAVLAAKPGYRILPARELKGDRFTAIGQLGVEAEYYVASPADTPRHTLRWVKDMFTWSDKLEQPEYQDLLHLQMPGDGAYFVAFYPRKRDWPAPVFATLGDGTIIKVSGDFGTDYGFLSALDATASGEGVSFKGTVGSVQDRKSGLVVSLGAKGEVRYQTFGLAADFAASLRIKEKQLTLELPEKVIDGDKTLEPMVPFPGGTVLVTAPGKWALAKPPKGVKLARMASGWQLIVPAGVRKVSLTTR